jgi:hypothetical protein
MDFYAVGGAGLLHVAVHDNDLFSTESAYSECLRLHDGFRKTIIARAMRGTANG